MASFADLGTDLHSHDLVWGAFLPDLQQSHDSIQNKREEFTLAQARSIDWPGVPLLMNHNNKKERVGITLAARVRDSNDTGGRARTEAIFKLNREPDVPMADPLSKHCSYQRALLMNGAHASLSLGHRHGTEYIGDCGTHQASTSRSGKDPGRVVHRVIDEISLCDHGLRPHSDIYEYLPCKRSLQHSSDRLVREFVKQYNYVAPPQHLEKPSANWDSYIQTLVREVDERRERVLSDNGYNHLLGRSSGTHAASLGRPLQPVPWVVMNASQSLTTMSDSNPVATTSQPASAPPQQQRTTAEVVPNTANPNVPPPPTSSASEALDIAQQFRAVVAQQAAELEQLRAEKKEGDAKRKREDEDKHTQELQRLQDKKKKSSAQLESYLETAKMEPNYAKQFAQSANAAIESAQNDNELEKVLAERNFQLDGIHAAHAKAKQEALAEMQSNNARQAHELKSYLMNHANGTSTSTSAFSGGGSSAPTIPTQALPANVTETDTVRASAFNIFGENPNRKTTEVVPDRTQAGPAPSTVDLQQPGGYAAAAAEFMARSVNAQSQVAVFPSHQAIASGGVIAVTKHVASHDGSTRQETTFQPRQVAIRLGMQHQDPEGFKQIVDGIQEQMKAGGIRRTHEIGEGRRMAVFESNSPHAKPKYFTKFNGPMQTDGFTTVSF